jgi:hypothetical protein
MITLRHLISPQKWNKYAYVENNPLISIDPDGEDDFTVFRPLANSDGEMWSQIKADAPKHGNTVTVYNGADATADRYVKALQSADSHVIFDGHGIEYADPDRNGLVTGGSVLLAGNVGVGVSQPENGTLMSVPDVLASSVAVFGCNGADLKGQYGNAVFTGTRPATDTNAGDRGAGAYTSVLSTGGTVGQATSASRVAITNATNAVNQNDPKYKGTPLPTPQVCTTQNGSTTCR